MFVSAIEVDIALRGFILAALALIWVTFLIRINGLRTLSKMTNFDFIMTIAMGSVAAGAIQADSWTVFGQAFLGMAGLVFVQWVAAKLRGSSDTVKDLMQNEALLVMKDGKILHAALESARMTESDLVAKLREANALQLDNVRAVVLETTGDISVLHGDYLDERLLDGVRRK